MDNTYKAQSKKRVYYAAGHCDICNKESYNIAMHLKTGIHKKKAILADQTITGEEKYTRLAELGLL
jgi:hypothetical protein